MAGSFGDVLEDEILDHIFGVGEYAAPDTYIALSTADPTDDGSGVAEPVGGAYARVQCAAWDAAVGGATANTGAISFTQATGDWGTITHFAIFDAAEAGNMLAHGDLTVGKEVYDGDTVSFAAGELDITLA